MATTWFKLHCMLRTRDFAVFRVNGNLEELVWDGLTFAAAQQLARQERRPGSRVVIKQRGTDGRYHVALG